MQWLKQLKLHIIKPLKLDKNSFTLFETLLSITLLSIVIVSFSKNSFYDNFDKEYMTLNSIENSFSTHIYDKTFIKTSKNINLIINDTKEETFLINKITYKKENIELFKYEIKKWIKELFHF